MGEDIKEFVKYFIGGEIVKKIFTSLGEKVGEKVIKKVENQLNKFFSLDESGKGLGDEILFTSAVCQLSDDEAEKISLFEDEVSKKTKEEIKSLTGLEVDGIRLLTALRVFVAFVLKDAARQVKVTDKTDVKKPLEESYLKFDYTITSKFFRCLLSKNTTDERIKFLYNRSVFSTVTIKKQSEAEEFFSEAKDTAKKATETVIGTTIEIAKKIAESAKTNSADIDIGGKAKSFRERAQDYYNSAPIK
ncbi:MAG: hypothetical protein WCG28_03965 [bacterium]